MVTSVAQVVHTLNNRCWAPITDPPTRNVANDRDAAMIGAAAGICPTIVAFLRTWSCGLTTSADQARLVTPLLSQVRGTWTTGPDVATRAWLVTDWLVRVHAATWCDGAELHQHATRLRALPPLTTDEESAAPLLAAAHSAAVEEGNVSTPRTEARAAVRAAGGDAAWAAGRVPYVDVAWQLVDTAARGVEHASLGPTVATLQASAVDLVTRMIGVSTQTGLA